MVWDICGHSLGGIEATSELKLSVLAPGEGVVEGSSLYASVALSFVGAALENG